MIILYMVMEYFKEFVKDFSNATGISFNSSSILKESKEAQ